MKKVISTKNAPEAIGPYVQGLDLGNLMFLSGQIPLDSKTGEFSSDIAEQTKQSLANIKAILEEGGAKVEHIVKTTIFVKDLANFAIVNKVYEQFFIDNGCQTFPARSCVEVARIPKDVGVEIEVIAYKE